MNKGLDQSKNTNTLEIASQAGTGATSLEPSEEEDVGLYVIQSSLEPNLSADLQIEGTELKMEIDTGGAMSAVSEKTRQKLFPKLQLEKSNVRLRTYTGERLTVHGEAMVNVEYRGQKKLLPLLIVDGDGPSLMGRNWPD